MLMSEMYVSWVFTPSSVRNNGNGTQVSILWNSKFDDRLVHVPFNSTIVAQPCVAAMATNNPGDKMLPAK